ncbi:helix-turn-helix domain-containing protein [Paenibacillus polymyxa]|uniref:helix-turn-helix domain-containing protein n=1 Tax=Paenibacillus polymyxa TaxID=1406 RepID=UPI0008FB5657|nr:helix-turn-helix domain-containing protein [Paenibacillus polymyxa]
MERSTIDGKEISFLPNEGYDIYIPQSVSLFRRLSCKQLIPSSPGAHRLVVFKSTSGVLHLRKHFVQTEKNDVLLLAPDAQASIQFVDPHEETLGASSSATQLNTAAAIVIVFSVYRLGESKPANELLSMIPYETRMNITDESRLLDLAGTLDLSLKRPTPVPEESRLKQQIALQELLLFLMENIRRNTEISDNIQAVKHTVTYIESHYQQNITARQLYSIAGVAKWQYSTLFKSITGKKPLDYVLDIRMKHAKRLLLQTEDTIAQIAQAVGFKDESYFARKFRQTEGITPRQYEEAASVSSSPVLMPEVPYKRIVAVGYSLGDLLSLGITPIGADVEIIGKRGLYWDSINGIEDIGLLGEPGKIRKLLPDLIIHSGFRQDWIEELASIAPTVLIDRYEHVYSRIMQTAELMNRQKLAQQWIYRHRAASKQMWIGLTKHMDVKQTAAVFSIVEGNLYIMSMKGFAVTVYHPDGMQPPPKVKELIQAGIPFQLTRPEHACSYEADTHFILMDNDPRTIRLYRRLMQLPYWNSKSIDRIILTENKYNFDDPLTMDRLLLELPQMILKKSH